MDNATRITQAMERAYAQMHRVRDDVQDGEYDLGALASHVEILRRHVTELAAAIAQAES